MSAFARISLAASIVDQREAAPARRPPSYLYYNGHGDLAAETDGSGARTALHTYDPFGAPLDTQPADQTVRRYAGEWATQYDTTSSLVLMGARPYDPGLGRFLAVDPVDGGSLNNYDYAGQDPVNGYDLSGLMTEEQLLYSDPDPSGEIDAGQTFTAPDPGPGSADEENSGKPFSESTKNQARDRADGKCQYCGKQTSRNPGPDQSNIDHNVPKSRGGDNSLDNAVSSCRTCNLTKGAKTGREFVENRENAGRM